VNGRSSEESGIGSQQGEDPREYHLPGDEDPLSQGWLVKERLDGAVDAVVDAGDVRYSSSSRRL